MLQLAKLQKRRLEVTTALRALSDEAAKRESGQFTDAERDQATALRAEFKSIEADISVAEEVLERSKPADRKAVEDPSSQRSEEEGKEQKRTEYEEGFHIKPPSPFRNLADQLRAVMFASQNRASEDDRNKLRSLNEWHMKERAAAGLSEAVDSDGGYLIQPQYVSQLMERAYNASNLAQRCSRLGLTSNRIKIPGMVDDNFTDGNRWGGVQAYWSNEADTATATKPKFRYIDISLEKLLAFAYATDEELEDVPALAGIIQSRFGFEFGYKLDQAIPFGDGVGKPQGYMNSKAKIQVAKESGQAAGTILFKNVVKMRMRGWAPSRPNMVWLVNQDCELQLITMVFDTSSTIPIPVFLPANSAAGQPYDRLLNIPVIPILQAKSVGTEGDIMLVDLNEYLLVDKNGMRADSSMHVQFLTAQQCFRFQYRVNGQTPWDKPVTPENGSNTQSPFVSLQSR